MHVENNPLEFEDISFDDEENPTEVWNDFEGPTLESDDEANAWIWNLVDAK